MTPNRTKTVILAIFMTTTVLSVTAIVLPVGMPVAFAQEATGNTIQAIRVDGSQRIDTANIRSYISLAVGDPFDPIAMNRALRELYRTGLFKDVKIYPEGRILVIEVVENPTIRTIAFEGNSTLKTDTLQAELQSRELDVFTLTKVQADTQRLTDLYQRSGRYFATVKPAIIELPNNQVNLVFEIDESERTRINSIRFIGNRFFNDGALRPIVSTKETAWYRFLSSDDGYDPDRLNYDKELLRQHYLRYGFADFEVVSVLPQLSRDKRAFDIFFTVNEGVRYTVTKVDVTSSLRNVAPERFREFVDVKEGEFFNNRQVETTIERITQELGNQGYAFVDVRPQFNKDPDTASLEITFDIREGPKVYVERIDIVNNTRTLDRVIRREFRLDEGDAYNASRLEATERRLNNLGFFEKVTISSEQGSAPDQTRIKVDVEEKPTGELSIGAGYSSTEALLGEIRLSERNFLGKGQNVRVATTLSGRRQQYDFGFTEPYFLERELAAGFDLYRITTSFQRESAFQERRTGGNLRLGYRLGENLSQTLTYSLRRVSISDVSPSASRFVREQEGRAVTSSLAQTLTYDERDNRFEPSRGYYVALSNEAAGLGGTVRYLRSTITTGNYFPYNEDWVFSILTDTGYVFGLGNQDVRINDRFFIGGDNLRGFETAGIGPRDRLTRDALGGDLYTTATAEMRFPLGLPEELGISGRAFIDAGTLLNLGNSDPDINDTGKIRVAYGFGLAWKSPFGPVRLDFALPLVKEDFDQTEFFRFSFGTRF